VLSAIAPLARLSRSVGVFVRDQVVVNVEGDVDIVAVGGGRQVWTAAPSPTQYVTDSVTWKERPFCDLPWYLSGGARRHGRTCGVAGSLIACFETEKQVVRRVCAGVGRWWPGPSRHVRSRAGSTTTTFLSPLSCAGYGPGGKRPVEGAGENGARRRVYGYGVRSVYPPGMAPYIAVRLEA
jgi:hypothetical protein